MLAQIDLKIHNLMSRILTGVQSTGTPHLGNLLGAILPAIKMANDPKNEAFLFIADMHSLTQIKDGNELRENTYSTAATWLACGFFPYQRLTLAHGFKDKSDRLGDVNTGLFTYPMLMAADILLYDAEIVPVGKDQLQHLEMARDVANRFNNIVGETLVPPDAKIQEGTKLVPGTDGEKMSKSRNNIINIFLSDKQLRKQVMSIKTDSKGLEEPKDPETDNVFGLYKLLASDAQIATMRANYEGGNYGYGHAKQALYELIIEQFSTIRERYNHFMENKHEIDAALEIGAQKATIVANGVLKRVRAKIGY